MAPGLNPNNWHFVNRDVTEQTEKHLKGQLEDLKAEEGDVTVKISEFHRLKKEKDPGEGEDYVEISQKRGKVSVMFTINLHLDFTGSAPDAEEVSGTITVLDIDAIMSTDEYQYTVKLDENKKEHEPVKDLVQSKIIPQIKSEFDGLIPWVRDTFTDTIQHKKDKDPSSGFAKAPVHPEREKTASPAAPTTQQNKNSSKVNTTTLTEKNEFSAPIEELYECFVDPQRIAAFTRGAPNVFEGAQPGGKFVIFNGAVSGEYLELDKPNRIVQSWRLNSWPEGHYSTVKMEFEKDDKRDSTVLNLTWDGIPIGEDGAIKQNWDGRYVTPIKLTFGFGGGPQ